jgi:hypothetical protein
LPITVHLAGPLGFSHTTDANSIKFRADPPTVAASASLNLPLA